jgi:hypothetical protein
MRDLYTSLAIHAIRYFIAIQVLVYRYRISKEKENAKGIR